MAGLQTRLTRQFFDAQRSLVQSQAAFDDELRLIDELAQAEGKRNTHNVATHVAALLGRLGTASRDFH